MIKDKLIESFLNFSLEANTRSTVNLHDGLKPVHRRVLYGMLTLSKAHKDFVGGAKVVGDVLGELHPHSDRSVYDAAVRLAQPFKTRYPLIDFSGNLGSVAQPTGWAHQRYTKMKISPIGLELLKYIDKDTVQMVETYNGEGVEPVNLPGLLPIALLNGTLGIGVGMASSLPPHNLNEVMGAASYLVTHPLATTADLMKFIKGPDFPTGNQVINPEGLLDAYETGRGSVKIRSNYSIKNENGKTSIVIEEVPFLIDPETRIIEVIREMYENGYEYIEDIINHTGKNNPFKLEIVLRKGAPVYSVLEKLHKETGIETSFTINNTVYLGNNKFKCLSLKEMLQSYIDNSYKVLVDVAKFDLKEKEDRLEIVEGLIKAIVLIEEIIPVIRASKNNAEAATNLMNKWSFTERQTKAILDMKLSRLTNLDENKLKNEKLELLREINDLRAFISDKNLQTKAILELFQNFKEKYGDARRTKIAHAKDIAEGEVGKSHVFISEGQMLALEELPVNRRNTKGKKFNSITAAGSFDMKDKVMVLLEDGSIVPLDVASINRDGGLIDMKDLLGGVPVDIKMYSKETHYCILTENGTLKKSSIAELNFDKSTQAIKLKDEDKARKLFFSNEKDVFVAVRSSNKYVAFAAEDVKESARMTMGSAAVTGDFNTLTLVTDGLLLWDEDSSGKIVKKSELVLSGRRNQGLTCGDSIGGVAVSTPQTIVITSDDEKAIFIPSSSVSVLKISSKGVKLYNGKIDKIFTM